jgi:uncharacterized protein involved in exopolysaccharide biosynthesis
MSTVLLRLRGAVAERKWIIWVAVVFVLLVVFQIGLSLLPHHVLNTMLQFEEKSNGVRELPNGVKAVPGSG